MSETEVQHVGRKVWASYLLWALAVVSGLVFGTRLAEMTGNYRMNEASIVLVCPSVPIILIVGTVLGRPIFGLLKGAISGKTPYLLTFFIIAMMATAAIYLPWAQACQGQCGGSHFARLRADIRAECPPDCALRDMAKFSLVGETLDRADFSGTNLEKAQLNGASLAHANLSEANLTEASLMYADLSGADLSGANFDEAFLAGANLRGAIIDGNTHMDEQWLTVWKLQNNAAGDLDLRQAFLQEANLSWLALSDLDLSGANLLIANLDGSDLSGVTLTGSSLVSAFVRHADLTDADLRAADLTNADLRDSDLSGADLTDANLKMVNLQGAKYTSETRWPDGFDPAAADTVLVPSS